MNLFLTMVGKLKLKNNMHVKIGKNIRQKLGGLGYKKYGQPHYSYQKFILGIRKKSYFHFIIFLNEAYASLHIDTPKIGKTKKGYSHTTTQNNPEIREESNKFK